MAAGEASAMVTPLLKAQVRTLRHEAENVISIELVPETGALFPAFSPGAHIDLHLPNGLVRSYSLANGCDERHRYLLAVHEAAVGRGGSRYVHSELRCGARVEIGAPRNHFPLIEDAASTLLIAGGIGITPILGMYRRLTALRRPVTLHYCCRGRAQAAFLDEIEAIGGSADFWFDEDHGGQPIDLAAVLAGQPRGVHAYCCGPKAMIARFEALCAQFDIADAHVERFSGDAAAPSGSHYQVRLNRTGKTLAVAGDRTLLQTLLEAGVALDHSCQEGVCGSCEVRVLSGAIDHRDCVLSAAERASNKTMMACVSHCVGRELVLDL